MYVLFLSFVNLGCKCSPISASIKSDKFSIREKKFLDCTRGQNVAPARLTLTCSDDHPGLCWKSCPKCGSTSLSRTFRNKKRVLVEECDFLGVQAILLFTRPVIERFMSAYGQITFQGYKRVEKRREAERNKYALVDPSKNARKRLSLFLDAMEDPIQRKLIPDVYHADPMINFYESVQTCLQLSSKSTQAENVPDLFILNLDKVKEEFSAVSNILNLSLPIFQFETRHSGAKSFKMKKCGKCQMQFAARSTRYTTEQRERILKLYEKDAECFIE